MPSSDGSGPAFAELHTLSETTHMPGLDSTAWARHPRARKFRPTLDGYLQPTRLETDGPDGVDFEFRVLTKSLDTATGTTVFHGALYVCTIAGTLSDLRLQCNCQHFSEFSGSKDQDGRPYVCKHLEAALLLVADPTPRRTRPQAPSQAALDRTYHGPHHFNGDKYAALLNNFTQPRDRPWVCTFQDWAEAKKWVDLMAPEESPVWDRVGEGSWPAAGQPFPGTSLQWKCVHRGGVKIEVSVLLPHGEWENVYMLPTDRLHLVKVAVQRKHPLLHPGGHQLHFQGRGNEPLEDSLSLADCRIGARSRLELRPLQAAGNGLRARVGSGPARGPHQVGHKGCACTCWFRVERCGRRNQGQVRVKGCFRHNAQCLERHLVGPKLLPTWSRKQLDQIVNANRHLSVPFLQHHFETWAWQKMEGELGITFAALEGRIRDGTLEPGRAYTATPVDVKNALQRSSEGSWKLHACELTSLRIWVTRGCGGDSPWVRFYQDQTDLEDIVLVIMTQEQKRWLVEDGSGRDLQLDATMSTNEARYSLSSLVLKPSKDEPAFPVAHCIHARASTEVLRQFLDAVADAIATDPNTAPGWRLRCIVCDDDDAELRALAECKWGAEDGVPTFLCVWHCLR